MLSGRNSFKKKIACQIKIIQASPHAHILRSPFSLALASRWMRVRIRFLRLKKNSILKIKKKRLKLYLDLLVFSSFFLKIKIKIIQTRMALHAKTKMKSNKTKMKLSPHIKEKQTLASMASDHHQITSAACRMPANVFCYC